MKAIVILVANSINIDEVARDLGGTLAQGGIESEISVLNGSEVSSIIANAAINREKPKRDIGEEFLIDLIQKFGKIKNQTLEEKISWINRFMTMYYGNEAFRKYIDEKGKENLNWCSNRKSNYSKELKHIIDVLCSINELSNGIVI